MPKGIIVFGLNGSGKSTVGKELAKRLDYKYMDIEDYHFIESEVPYTKWRTKEERLELMLKDICEYDNFVLSAVTGYFGDEIEALYEFAVLLEAPNELRVERVKNRVAMQHGERVEKYGDMYEQHMKFMEYVKTRSSDSITNWQSKLECPVLTIDTTKNFADNMELIVQEYQNLKI